MPWEKALNVCLNERFFAVSKERASAMTPLGPVFAWKDEFSGMSMLCDIVGRVEGGEALSE